MLRVNILTRFEHRLFDQHIDHQRFDGRISFHENACDDIAWDCVVVFDGLSEKASVKVASGALLFVAGEPPDAITYTGAFLDQFDHTYCAHPRALVRKNNDADQYFNDWHFGRNPSEKSYRYGFEQVRDLVPPVKCKDMSLVMSDLAYMPNHLKRLRLLDAVRQRFGDKVDIYGRGHRFIPYKEAGILPYRFHLCIENCAVPDLWTEKIADAFLGYAVPVYAGCPNITKYFPEQSVVQLDLDDMPSSLAIIERLLQMSDTEYQRRRPFLEEARARLFDRYNLIDLLADFVEARRAQPRHITSRMLIPNERTPTYSFENTLLRGKRLLNRKLFQLTHRNVAQR